MRTCSCWALRTQFQLTNQYAVPSRVSWTRPARSCYCTQPSIETFFTPASLLTCNSIPGTRPGCFAVGTHHILALHVNTRTPDTANMILRKNSPYHEPHGPAHDPIKEPADDSSWLLLPLHHCARRSGLLAHLNTWTPARNYPLEKTRSLSHRLSAASVLQGHLTILNSSWTLPSGVHAPWPVHETRG